MPDSQIPAPEIQLPNATLDARLEEILDELNDQVVCLSLADVILVPRPDFFPFAGRIPLLIKGLDELLVSDARFGDRGRLMVCSDNGSMSFYPASVRNVVLNQLARSRSVQSTTEWLSKVLKTERATGCTVSILYGVSVEDEFEVAPGVRLAPLEKVPNSRQLERFLHSALMDHKSFESWNPPKAALLTNRTIDPFIWTLGVDGNPIGPGPANNRKDYLRVDQLHEDVARVLTILGPSLPLIVESWFVFDDPDLQVASSNDWSRSWKALEIAPLTYIGEKVLISSEAAPICAAYLDLELDVQLRVNVGLNRLRQAQSRRSAGDKAVEVFIALEALLGDGENNELSHKISVRAARLLGGTASQRLATFSLLKKFYGVRSKMVHSGRIEEKQQRINSDTTLTVEDLATRCIGIAAQVVRAIVVLGHVPDWKKFDLTDHP
ncbi:MAG: hypothetical protein KF796_03635 [Ramlibacter sp.]|nr:hypothetical protein [Ramlibacter sp.]